MFIYNYQSSFNLTMVGTCTMDRVVSIGITKLRATLQSVHTIQISTYYTCKV